MRELPFQNEDRGVFNEDFKGAFRPSHLEAIRGH